MPHPPIKLLLGLAFWLALIGWVGRLLNIEDQPGTSAFSQLRRYFARKSFECELRFPFPVALEVGDSVHLEGEEGRPVGEVCALLGDAGKPLPFLLAELPDGVRRARIRLFDRDAPRLHAGARAKLVAVPHEAAAWVLKTLVTPSNLPLVRAEWEAAFPPRFREQLFEILAPLLRDLISDCEQVIEVETAPFLERHRAQVERLSSRLKDQLGQEKLAQLFEEEVWPILKARMQPVFDEIGAEIWERAPLWSLTWRLAFQSLPLTAGDYFEKRWNRFVAEEVVPIIRAHAGDIIEASREIARGALENERLSGELRDAFLRLIGEPDFHRLAQAYVDEVFIENPRFRERLELRWRSPEAQAARDLVSSRLEGVVRRIADILLGTREGGITPEFSRVLRAQILQKDARRVLIHPGSPDQPLLTPGARLEAPVEWEARK